MCAYVLVGAGDGEIQQQENGSANGILDFVSSRRQSTRSRAESNKEQGKTPLIEVKILSPTLSVFSI
jgi:hypothetical protein